MSTKSTLWPCPLCGGEGSIMYCGVLAPYGWCRKCGFPAPYRKSVSAAARVWNQLGRQRAVCQRMALLRDYEAEQCLPAVLLDVPALACKALGRRRKT